MKKRLNGLALLLFLILVFVLSIRGLAGNTNEQNINNPQWLDNGPLELSPERGRFALLMSFIENGSFYFSQSIARFATPDLGIKNGNYVSLFAPGVSFIVAPGYLLGKLFGLSQVGAFAIIAVFAILNAFLVRAISKTLGASLLASNLGGLVFLLATPAFAYGTTLYQHHISTFLILLSIYLLIRFNNIKSLVLVWLLCAASIPVDYPNLILMFPIGLTALARFINLKIITDKNNHRSLSLTFVPAGILTFFGAILPLAFFLWFNKVSYNNPFQLSGTVQSVQAIDANGAPISSTAKNFENVADYKQKEAPQKSAVGFFKTRNLINGFYIHIFSPDRGIIYFSPVILFGLIGAAILYKQRNRFFPLIFSIIMLNLLLYSLWGDPWGGWAFGSRYLIPSYSLMAIFISVFLSKYSKNLPIVVIFFVIAAYSVSINSLGAITTSRIPPQVEVLELEKLSGNVEKYNYQRSYDFLKSGQSKSLVFQSFFKGKITAMQYYLFLNILIDSYLILNVINLIRRSDQN